MKRQRSSTGYFWQRFKQNRLAVWSLRVLCFLLFVAVFADFIANDKPLYAEIEGAVTFPVFKEVGMNIGLLPADGKFKTTKWKNKKYERVIWTPIPYSSMELDFKNAQYKSPFQAQNVPSFRFRHLLGTDQIGRDIAAGMVHGTRIALLVGLLAMLVASIIGIFFGTLAGWYGDESYHTSRASLLLNILAIFPAWFYGFSVRSYLITEAENPLFQILLSLGIVCFIFLMVNLLARLLERNSYFDKSLIVPMDLLVMRFIEVMNSIPALLILLATVAILTKQSIIMTMLIIGLLAWTPIARFVRAELMRIKKMEYIEAARSLGLPNRQIIWRHALPNALTPVLITIAFGIAGAILLEASLSFLGIGAGADEMTWGRILRSSRDYFSAWWLAVFPGLAIFLTVVSFNLIGEGLTDALDNKKSTTI